RVTSTQEMYDEVHRHYAVADVVIAAAAVSDYKPKMVAGQKIKKAEENMVIELTKTQDILASLGEAKKHQKLIGFALETNNEEENAQSKLQRKNLDFIVLNSMQDEGAGFRKDTNKITILFADGEKKAFGLKPKSEVATDILNEIVHLLDA
ncbi:MAG: phosphopantothenoylcysteine decarboxylase, partial [Salegentibacter sp.]